MSKRLPTSAVRVIDANANRALEGLRVCEEIIRLHLGTRTAFRASRALRHAVGQAIRTLPITPTDRVRARDSRTDLGRAASTTPVDSLERLLLINFQRAKESLRTLEECSRLVAPRQTVSFQRLRFRTYEVERAVLLRVAALRHH